MVFNINGQMVESTAAYFIPESRGYRYGDGFFESMKLADGLLLHSVLHWERIRKSALLLKMELPENFDRDELISRIENSAISINAIHARVRCTFFRESPGLYAPIHSNTCIVIEIQPLNTGKYEWNEAGLTLGSFTELIKNSNYTSMLKSTSAQLYVMAGIHARESGFDDCVIFNDQNRIAETISSNIFMVSGEFIITPPLSEYCVDGVMRKVVMNLATAYGYSLLEQPMSEVTLTSADEVFLTSATRGIRWVASYKGKKYRNTVAKILADQLNPGEL